MKKLLKLFAGIAFLAMLALNTTAFVDTNNAGKVSLNSLKAQALTSEVVGRYAEIYFLNSHATEYWDDCFDDYPITAEVRVTCLNAGELPNCPYWETNFFYGLDGDDFNCEW